MSQRKKVLKKVLKPVVATTKQLLKRSKLTRNLGRKIKHTLFPETIALEREIYRFHEYYPTIEEYVAQKKLINTLKNQPLISILLPTYNTPPEYLAECINSVLIQSYENWELCIADDASTNSDTVAMVKKYARQDTRIRYKIRKENGHISNASNTALKMAKGDYVALLDHDDILWPNALYEMVAVINTDPLVDFIYTDEDKIDGTGETHSYPFLKPDFSPQFLESCNYITHFSCIRTSLMKEIGGFRVGYEGAQDWDLFMRLSEKTGRIKHIPKILYSWRIHEASTASDTDAKPYVYEAQRKLLVDHVQRSGRKGEVTAGIIPQHRTIRYEVPHDVQLAVCVYFHSKVQTKRLVRSMQKYSAGVPTAIIYFSDRRISKVEQNEVMRLNPSVGQEFVQIPKDQTIYAAALRAVKQEYLLFINDNVEIASNDWGALSVADCLSKDVAAVGPILLDRTKRLVKSAGLGIGYGQKKGILNMLEDASFDDHHYTRGLYIKSRRNVSALNEAMFAIKKDILKKAATNTPDSTSLFLSLIKQNYRHVYTPYIQAIFHGKTRNADTVKEYYEEDPYLNPNFDHLSQSMQVK